MYRLLKELTNAWSYSIIVCVVGEHCELEEHDGHHVLQCAWARVKRVLTDYDFALLPQKEQVGATAVMIDAVRNRDLYSS